MSRSRDLRHLLAVALIGSVSCSTSSASSASSVVYRHLTPPPYTKTSAVGYGDESHQLADLYVPDGVSGEPVVLWLHGGAWVSGGRNDVSAEFVNDVLGSGAALVSMDYELTWALGTASVYSEDLGDIAQAMDWIEEIAALMGWDPSRIVLAGFSAGATLAVDFVADDNPTNNPLASDPSLRSRVVGVVGFSGIYGLYSLAASNPSLYPGLYYLLGCALSGMIDGSEPPMMLIHGLNDRVVPSDQSSALATALRAAGVGTSVHYSMDVGHEPIQWTYDGTWVSDSIMSFTRR
jgi:acetyl esterase/lipase